jgi:hypothetical protein
MTRILLTVLALAALAALCGCAVLPVVTCAATNCAAIN